MRDLILSAVNPDNTPHGYNWTFAFPMLLFIVIALVLWALFGRPHQRVPARRLAPGLGSPRRSGAHLTASVDKPHAGETADEGEGHEPTDGSASGAAGASE